MTLVMFSVYDKKAKVYSAPFVARNQLEAVRMTQMQLEREPNGVHCTHAHDFELYMVGDWIDDRGEILAQEKPTHVADFDTLLPREVSDNGQ